jgi:hypothetical protein
MTNFTLDKNGSDDIIDSRDIVERIEELEAELAGYDAPEAFDANQPDAASELNALRAFVEEIEQYAGDKASDGITCVKDSYFTDYAQQLLEDCGEIPKDLPHYIEIDWEATAINIRVDYTSCELDGKTFWIR